MVAHSTEQILVTYECFSVGLVYAVLHCFVYETRIRWRASEGGSENSESLEIEHLYAFASVVHV